jgi:Uma2 family endonuclease
MTTQTQRLTYEEYLKGPEIKQRYSIIDGVMKMAPAPTLDHQRILRNIGMTMHSFVDSHNIGEVFFVPVDVILSKGPLLIRQPDFLFVSKERQGILKDAVEGAPDLIGEVLSPYDNRASMHGALADYAAIGVRECWFISPQGSTVEVLTLENGEWQRDQLAGTGGTVTSKILPGFEVEVSGLFPIRQQRDA